MLVAPQVQGNSIIATYADDTGLIFANVVIICGNYGPSGLAYWVLDGPDGSTTYYVTLQATFACPDPGVGKAPAVAAGTFKSIPSPPPPSVAEAQCRILVNEQNIIDLSGVPTTTFTAAVATSSKGSWTCDVQVTVCGPSAGVIVSGADPICWNISSGLDVILAAPQQVGNAILFVYNVPNGDVWNVYVQCGTTTLSAPNGFVVNVGEISAGTMSQMTMVLESSAACFSLPTPVPTPAPVPSYCTPLVINNTTVDLSTIGTVTLEGVQTPDGGNYDVQVNLCNPVSSCEGTFNSFISKAAPAAGGSGSGSGSGSAVLGNSCMAFGVFSRMISAPQVIGDAIFISYADVGSTNFATVILQCGNTSLNESGGSDHLYHDFSGINTYTFLLQSTAACFGQSRPVTSAPTLAPTTATPPTTLAPATLAPPPTTAAPAASRPVTTGKIVGAAVAVASCGLFVAATLGLNWRQRNLHFRAVATMRFWTIVPRLLCCRHQEGESGSDVPLMAAATSVQEGTVVEGEPKRI
jgi:hypothetical protein